MRIVVTEAEIYNVDPRTVRDVEPRRNDDGPAERDDVPGTTPHRNKGLGHRIVFADSIEIP